MIYPRPWRPFPLALLALSLALHLVTITLYVRLPDRFAAFTVFPIWVWGMIGLGMATIAFVFFRAKLSLSIITLWTFSILLLADEAKPLGRIGRDVEKITASPAAPFKGNQVLRVVTLNCAKTANPSASLKAFEPDVVFLQEVPHAYSVKRLIDDLYGGAGDYRIDGRDRLAIAVRGEILRELRVQEFRNQFVKAELTNGLTLQLVNVHLGPAATNLRLHDRECWREHKQNRLLRQVEMKYALAVLRQGTDFPRTPAILGGDFNAPANDAVYRLLDQQFLDSFEAAGTGWANTYHRALPLLRIDHLYSSSQLIPVRSKVFEVEDSDHRMVIADYVY